MTVAIIVPTRDKAPRLRLTLACLAASPQCVPGTEVVVVDDHSTDETRAIVTQAAERLPVRVVAGRGLGRAAARNDGASASAADIFLFLDDDVLVKPSFVATHAAAVSPGAFAHGPLREYLQAPQLVSDLAHVPFDEAGAIVAALVTGPDEQRPVRNAVERAVLAMADGSAPPVVPWLAAVGANFGVHRDDFVRAGGYDEQFGTGWGCEDLELGYRLCAAGVRPVLVPEAGGIHLTHERSGRWEEHGPNLARFAALHRDPAVVALPALLAADASVRRYFEWVGGAHSMHA